MTLALSPPLPTRSPEPVAFAVLGAGRWGRVHAGKLASAPWARLVGVVDPDLQAARRLGEALGVPSAATLDGLPRAPEAAVIAAPLGAMVEAASACLARGTHTLIEKPGAPSAAALAALSAAADEADLRLAVGYVERFNPTLRSILAEDGGRARLIARRAGPPRPSMGPIHLDWLVHDIDLAVWLLPSPLRVEAAALSPTAARVVLRGGGVEARLSADAAARSPRRRLWVDGALARLERGRIGDPLWRQLERFAASVRLGRLLPPLASASEAISVLSIAEAVEIYSATRRISAP